MKKTAKRVLSLILALSVLCSIFAITTNTAVAAEPKSANSCEVFLMDLPRAADPNKSGWGHPDLTFMNGWHASASKKMVVRSYDSYTGPTCYCIEPGVGGYTGDTLYPKGEEYWELFPKGLNKTIDKRTMEQLIGRVFQYGWIGRNNLNWNTTNPTHTDELGNLKATQILIHEVIIGERRADFTKINAHDYGCNNAIEQITPSCPIYDTTMRHYKRIEAAVLEHVKIPNFGGSQFEMRYDGSKYTVTLTDSNNIISKCSVTSNANVELSVNGNQLTVSATTPPTGDIVVAANKLGTKRAAFIAWTDYIIDPKTKEVQDQISYKEQIADPLPAVTVRLKISTGNVKVIKESEDGVVDGIKFHAEGAGVNKDVITGKNGEFQLEGLRAGEKITFTELDVANRYVNPASQTVTVIAGQTVSVKFSNTLKRGAAIFQKTDLETDKEIETKDGIFKIQQWNKNMQQYIDHSQMVYDEAQNGYVTAEALIVTAANDGKFRWVEEKAPTGYLKPAENTIDFEITEDGQVYHINNGTVTNAPQKGRIGILKQGEVLTDFDFAQTEFGLKYSPIYTVQIQENAVYEVIALEDIYFNGELKYQKDELVDTVTTKSSGYQYTKDLYIGDKGSKFLVKEIKAPDHFFIGANEYIVDLTYHGQDVQLVTENVEGYNDRQKVKIRLQKEIEDNIYYPNPEAYKDVIWGVFSADDILDANGSLLLEKDSLVDCFGIDEAGQGISSTDLPPDTLWYVKELQTADGWLLDETIYPISFPANNETIPLLWIDLNDSYGVLENKTVKGFVEYKKVSAHDGTPLEAVYGVFRASDDLLIEELKSDLTDWTRSSELPKGEYYLAELIEPDHYHKDEQKYPFFIGEGNVTGVTIQIVVENEPIIGALIPRYNEGDGRESELHTPQTGADFSIIGVSLLAFLSATAIYAVHEERKKSRDKK